MTALNLKVIDIEELGISQKDFASDIKNVSQKLISYTLGWQRSRKRSGSAKVKQMSEISGTTAKPHKQKGTGHARQGSKRSVQFVGGRTCFGPTPRSFDYSLPKKIIKKAVSDVLKIKLSKKELLFIDIIDSEFLKTRQINNLLVDNKIKSALFLYDKDSNVSQNLINSVNNIKNVKTIDVKAINVYDLLKYDSLILNKSLLDNIKKIIS